ncbi:hypothetical protein IGI04_040601 [Brassica rapa subsp. trilocularis]|uniref:Uncharacterized protein n=1 Tax=Brassica rapa subsp. trilocularis TaxID=1813537 RepID=A0ABQ7KNA5_BRACM|nr:hypothetical protein IGI04_040601 [Brassica rapa subsp. trilocularis]
MNELYDSFDSEREHIHRSIKHSKNVDYSKVKRSHHHRSRKHDKYILIHHMMTITTDPDSVYASTRTRQTMSMVIDTVLVNVRELVGEHLSIYLEGIKATPLCKGPSLEMLGSRDEVKSV